MGIVATIEFGSKEGKERILFNITKAFKAIILWIVRIFYSLKYFLLCPDYDVTDHDVTGH